MPLTSKFRKLTALPWIEKTQTVSEYYWGLKTRFYYSFFWGHIGKRSKVIRPMRLRNVPNIYLGDNVLVHAHVFLLTLQGENSPVPKLSIGDGSVIGHMNHITCVDAVEIGKNVLTADRVYISDHSHNFSNVKVPVMYQGTVSKGRVAIGDGTWIGENVVILSCHIGKNCVVGANAVVLRDLPDYCVAVGAPARVIQKFNLDSQSWEKVDRSDE